ncbi:uncharacterized protein DUF664 [Micromonospora pisi]|uniref:Uncharacterized protein DUF664 n=1 Tax=Micromonospora pisi TaxID=589240 RepID=A0A495JAB3_9ACTN|nr:DUF664 domain-containing protein [Micromonospora pisi]RKR85867.1 uncharacterized protein DUF664 [Micromonospora pisi]
MSSAEILVDAFGRIRELVHDVVRDLSEQQLTYRVDRDANTIAWLVWHLTRIQDDHLADAAGTEQVWTAEGWLERFGLPFDPGATGYGASPEEVAAVRVGRDLLTGYYDAVHGRTVAYVANLTESDLARIVDPNWNPPVTLAVRLVSVVGDDLQHAGQAAFVRGIVRR